MATIYYPSQANILTRTITSSSLTQIYIPVEPDNIFYFSSSILTSSSSLWPTSSLSLLSDFSISSSWASSSLSSSYSSTASFALNGGAGGTDILSVQIFS